MLLEHTAAVLLYQLVCVFVWIVSLSLQWINNTHVLKVKQNTYEWSEQMSLLLRREDTRWKSCDDALHKVIQMSSTFALQMFKNKMACKLSMISSPWLLYLFDIQNCKAKHVAGYCQHKDHMYAVADGEVSWCANRAWHTWHSMRRNCSKNVLNQCMCILWATLWLVQSIWFLNFFGSVILNIA